MRFLRGMVFLALMACAANLAEAQPAKPNVFLLPQMQGRFFQLQAEMQRLSQAGDWAGVEARCREFLKHMPDAAAVHYDLACAQSRQGKTDPAIESLAKAVELGFTNVAFMQQDADLQNVRSDERYPKIIAQAQQAAQQAPGRPASVEPVKPENGAVTITSKCVGYDPRVGVFGVAVEFPKVDPPPAITTWAGDAGNSLRTWFTQGTAAGNLGDLYDNHDRDHANMDYPSFPQITRVEYGDEPKSVQLDHGLQLRMFFNAVTLGNSSTAHVGTPYWRSQPRAALTMDPLGPTLLAAQYQQNHLYIYPEHNDYDAGHNGQGGGHGDVYPVNTPYVIISHGSSGSDRPFLDAVAATLGAFRPEVKQFLAKQGALMPAVQMVFRASNKMVVKPEDYLTGKAHPPVFSSANLDPARMVKLAHEFERGKLPPVVRIRMLEEDLGQSGRDYAEIGPREKLFDTPAAIARMWRSRQAVWRMVVSAEASLDFNERPLKFHWVVLQGDASAISITPRGERGAVAEIKIPYFTRGPIAPGSGLESNRVDIGVFVHNGDYYSAPAFISLNTLDNEKRTYNDNGLLTSLDGADAAVSGNYVDPVLATVGKWRDDFLYDKQHRLLGWNRLRNGEKQQFTAEGALVTEFDGLLRPKLARTVVYQALGGEPTKVPVLEQQPGREILTYAYDSEEDRLGRVVSRTPAP